MTDAVATFIVTEERWMADALCKTTPDVNFYPGRGESTDAARAVCAVCPVRAECLEYALRIGERYGIWGGTSERERRVLRRERRAELGLPVNSPSLVPYQRPIDHGTTRGYSAHRARKEDACVYCKAAHAAYHRGRVAAWRQAQRDAEAGDAA